MSQRELVFSANSAKRTCHRVGVLSIVLLCGSMLATKTAKADTFVINDLTDRISLSTTSFRAGTLNCDTTNTEVCTFSLQGPSGATLVSPSGPTGIAVAESGGVNLSDLMSLSVGVHDAEIVFHSILAEVQFPCALAAEGSCQMTENGQTQTAFTLHWSDGTIDTIQFASDVETVVPEPTSILLLLTGFAGMGLSKIRSKRAS